MVQTVRVKMMKPRGSGRRMGWNKLVTGVDDSQKGGYSLVGEFLEERQYDLATGAVVVGQMPIGSARSGNHWRAGTVGLGGVEWDDRTWPLDDFLDFQDHVKTLLGGLANDVEVLSEERTRLLERVKELDLMIERAGQG